MQTAAASATKSKKPAKPRKPAHPPIEDAGPRRVTVLRFGCLAPTEGAELVRDQIRGSTRYRNTLVEIERGRRAARRDLERGSQEVAVLEVEAAEATEKEVAAVKAVKASKASSRTTTVPEELRRALTEARAARKEVVTKLREARAAARLTPEMMAEGQRIDEVAHELRKNAREHCGLYWGTYLLVEQADEAMRKKIPALFLGAEPNDPSFQRFTGEGSVGVQMQGDNTMGALTGGQSNWIRIVPQVPKHGGPPSKRSQKRQFAELWLRVGSNGAGPKSTPVWAKWPMVMHARRKADGTWETFPEGARVKHVRVTLRRSGPPGTAQSEEWAAILTLDAPDAQVRARRAGPVAIEVGWRQVEGGIRVATCLGADNKMSELIMPQYMIDSFAKADSLQSIRKKSFDAARDALVAWLATAPHVPEWLQKATATLSQWESAGRLHHLERRWAKNRWAGDEGAYEPLSKWRYHDHHLWQYEADSRTTAIRRRQDFYRVFAARLAATYDVAILKDMDLRIFARRPRAEAGAENETARANRQLAAVSTLTLAIKNAFRGHWFEEDSKDTTRRCHKCGAINDWDKATHVSTTCAACLVVWDQDVNSAHNLLHAWTSRPPEERKTEAEKKAGVVREGRWAKAKRMKAEKAAAQEQQVAS